MSEARIFGRRQGKQRIGESAQSVIDPATQDAFLEAAGKAVPVFPAAGGGLVMSPERVIETPGLYRLHVPRETLAAHGEGFRTSDGGPQWRALAGPFRTQAPRVDHCEPIVAGCGR